VPALTLPHFDESQFPSAGLEGAETKAAIPIEPAGAEEPVQALPAAGARSSPAYQGADRTVTPAEAAPAPADLALSRPAEPVVMGRYEAKDASYVMFSDGSIEANTKSGVFRFNSMSELKAFIEAQA
jgi:hypothetical protein